jgi:hypothetical protein
MLGERKIITITPELGTDKKSSQAFFLKDREAIRDVIE